MKPAKEKYYRGLFTIAALYDLLLGVTFTCFPARAFAALGISDKLPAFGGYVTLLGAFVLVIGIAYALISRGDLRGNADLILVGTLYKLAYAATAFYYWAAGDSAACRLRRIVRGGGRGLLRPDGGVLLVFEEGSQKLSRFALSPARFSGRGRRARLV